MTFTELNLQVTDTEPQLNCITTKLFSSPLGLQLCYNESALAFTSCVQICILITTQTRYNEINVEDFDLRTRPFPSAKLY